ncbi:hypothetical protein RJ639_025350 [Escallonia herrerae]|uniref:MBD domain-containing protein n=1 Tax=Escallonia herrerae TaxID=1293975 RepID=A0AA88UY67_9ASTE|nr:hypothetical protein RJ639_025350 [Escallonia herrerae]
MDGTGTGTDNRGGAVDAAPKPDAPEGWQRKQKGGGDSGGDRKGSVTVVVVVGDGAGGGIRWMVGARELNPKQGGTPRRYDFFFISPTGEEIKSRTQLDKYLKSHPGGPDDSAFNWGTENLRRSARLNQTMQVMDTPESGAPKKRQKTSRSREGETSEHREAVTNGAEESAGIAIGDGKAVGDDGEGEVVDNVLDNDQENKAAVVTEEALEEMNVEKTLIQETGSKTYDDMEEDADDSKPLPVLAPGLEENNNKSKKEVAEPEVLLELTVPSEAASFDQQVVEAVKDAEPEINDAKAESNKEVEEPVRRKWVSATDAEVANGKEHAENHSGSWEEAPQKPKASRVRF